MVRKEKDMKYAKNFKRALALMTAVSLGSFLQSENTEVLKNIRRFYYASKRDYYGLVKTGPVGYVFCLEEILEHQASFKEAYKISQNLELYATGKMSYDFEELYNNVLNYLRDNDEESTLYLCLIQSLMDYKGSNDVRFALNILIDPWQYKTYLEEKYGENVLEKVSDWKNFLCFEKNVPTSLTSHLSPFFEDSKELYEVCPLTDIEKEILSPYSSSIENKYGNTVTYQVVWNFKSRSLEEYEFIVSDNYLNNYHIMIPTSKNPYETIEETIEANGKNKIITALKNGGADDEKKIYNVSYLPLKLLAILDKDAILLKKDETYEDYFKRLEKSFPNLDVYRFTVCVDLTQTLKDSEPSLNDFYAYKIFIPLYLKKLSQKEKIIGEDIEIYNNLYNLFCKNPYLNDKMLIDFNSSKKQFDTELEYILYSKNNVELINEIGKFEKSLFVNDIKRTKKLFSNNISQ